MLDASMALALFFEDEDVVVTAAAVRAIAADGAVVPSLWRLEVANALRTAVRRKRCDQAKADYVLGELAVLPIVVDSETDDRAWSSIRDVSQKEGLTVYDAAYLELALRLGATLMSCDRELVACARARGLTVIAP
uniref:type II toxin-antitoxin system VapC family toxin n=1 Tax=uncultured Caulobacter sp. TaxID=158749 RepID=UPI0025FCBC44|nr:type II toxin-antitoxin system VapC family toxin [uncultured Caulobacter sp.]